MIEVDRLLELPEVHGANAGHRRRARVIYA